MKVQIIESAPGELAEKAEDVVKVVEKLTGRTLLKASTHEHKPRSPQFEYPALEGAVKNSRREVKRIKAIMDARIAEVLNG